MKTTTPITVDLLRSAKIPQDLFGNLSPGDDEAKKLHHIKAVFRLMSLKIHPDKCKAKDAAGLFDKLVSLRDLAVILVTGEKEKLFREEGVLTKPVTFKSGKFSYTLIRRLASGGGCDIFEGVGSDRKGQAVSIVARIPKNPGDNDLMEREAKAYGIFASKLKEISERSEDGQKSAGKFSWSIQHFIETFRLKEPSGKLKVANLFSRLPDFLDGWYSLEQIHKQYPQGVSTRQMAFIFNRGLEALTFTHHCGVVHGAITPNHFLVHAKSHVGNLIDWTASCHSGNHKVPYMDKRYASFFAPEAKDTNSAFPASDIYMLAWCMVYLLGGDPATGMIPSAVEAPVRRVLNLCLQPNRALRPTAKAVHDQFRQALAEVFGPPKFVELQMTNQP